MVNHLRTLLLNMPGSNAYPVTLPGEEFVPGEFAGVTFNNNLLAIYKMIFGLNPDRAMKNYRLREIMNILHLSDLAGFVTNYDSRITYWPPRNNSLYTLRASGPIITPAPGTTTQLTFLGPQGLAAVNESIYFNYSITVTDASHVSVTHNFTTDGNVSPQTFSYTVTSGLSSPISLPGSTYQFQFQSGVGASWTLSWLASPVKTLMNVYSDLTSGLTSDLALLLFGPVGDPNYGVFRQLWELSPSPPYRLGGVVLALGQRMNTLYAG